MPSMELILISAATFVGIVALVGAIAYLIPQFTRTRAEERLETFTGRGGTPASKSSILREETLAESLKMTPGLMESVLVRLGSLPKLVEQADTSLSLQQFLLLMMVFGVGGAATAWWLQVPMFLIPVAGGVLALLPTLWLYMKRRRRLKTLAAQLPDALELVARALRAGHSLASGMQVVSDEMPAPISAEFGRVYEEQNLGIPLEEAMRDMAERVPNLDLKFFVTAVQLQRQTGGDLAEILDKISYVIRERFKIYGQVQALTAEGRLSGVVLMLLPPALFVAVYYLNPKYISLLFTDPMGQQMLIGASVLQVLGALVIKKIVNIKV